MRKILIPVKTSLEIKKWQEVLAHHANTCELALGFDVILFEKMTFKVIRLPSEEVIIKRSFYDLRQRDESLDGKRLEQLASADHRVFLGVWKKSFAIQVANALVRFIRQENLQDDYLFSFCSGSGDIVKSITTEVFDSCYRVLKYQAFLKKSMSFYISEDNFSETLVELQLPSVLQHYEDDAANFIRAIQSSSYRVLSPDIAARVKKRSATRFVEFLRCLLLSFNPFSGRLQRSMSRFRALGYFRGKVLSLFALSDISKVSFENSALIAMPVMNDAQVALRSNFSTVFEVTRNCLVKGASSKVLIKLHPGHPGGLAVFEMLKIKLLFSSRVHLLAPDVDAREVLKRVTYALCVNSGMSYEALAYDKPVIILGKTFIRNLPHVVDFGHADIVSGLKKHRNLTELEKIMKCVYLVGGKPSQENNRKFLAQAIVHLCKKELVSLA